MGVDDATGAIKGGRDRKERRGEDATATGKGSERKGRGGTEGFGEFQDGEF